MEPGIDLADASAWRRLADRYMAEAGGPAPRFSHPDAPLAVLPDGSHLWTPSSPGPWPVVVAAHGGGFVVGHPLGAERIAVPLARSGIATLSIAYRRAPEYRAPAALDDVWAAVREIAVSRSWFGWSFTAALAVHGSSAGASLAAGVALRARDEGVALRLQSLSCPALDHRPHLNEPTPSVLGPSPTWSREAAAWMWRHYLGDAIADPPGYSVPALAGDLAGVAPAHIVIAEHDVLRDEAVAYARRLVDAGVACAVHAPERTAHGFDGLAPDTPEARLARRAQVAALVDALTAESGGP